MRAIVVGGGAYGLACAERMARGGRVGRADRAGRARRAARRLERPHARAALRVRRRRHLQRADACARATAGASSSGSRASGSSTHAACCTWRAPGGPFEERSLEVVRSLGIEIEQLSVPRDRAALAGVRPRARRVRPLVARGRAALGAACDVRARARRAGRGRRRASETRVDRRRPTARSSWRTGAASSADVVVLCTGSWSSSARRAARGRRPAAAGHRVLPRADRGRSPCSVTVVSTSTASPPTTATASRSAGTARRTPRSPIRRPTRRVGCAPRTSSRSPQYLARRLPSATGAPLVEADVCFYAMTADE